MNKGDEIRYYLQNNGWTIVWSFGDNIYAVPDGYICYDYEVQSIGFFYNKQGDFDFLIPNVEDEVIMKLASNLCHSYNKKVIEAHDAYVFRQRYKRVVNDLFYILGEIGKSSDDVIIKRLKKLADQHRHILK